MKIQKRKPVHLFVSVVKKNIAVLAVAAAILISPTSAFALDWSVSIGNTTPGYSYDSYGSYGGSYGMGGNAFGLPSGSIIGILSNLLFWLLSIFAIFGIIGFVLSGIFYLISAGDKDMIDKGKEGMKWSIVGVIVGLSGIIIMQAVNLMLDGMSSKF